MQRIGHVFDDNHLQTHNSASLIIGKRWRGHVRTAAINGTSFSVHLILQHNNATKAKPKAMPAFTKRVKLYK